MYLDDALNWKEHVEHLNSKLKCCIGIFYRKRSLLPNSCKQSLYFALVHSQISYGLELYGFNYISVLNPLKIMCNRTLRALQSKPRDFPVNVLYKNYNTLPIDVLFKFYILILVHKCYYGHNVVPDVISSMFVRNSDVHQYSTRSKLKLHLSNKSIQSLGSRVFLASGLWNELSDAIKNCNSLDLFKAKLKQHLIQ